MLGMANCRGDGAGVEDDLLAVEMDSVGSLNGCWWRRWLDVDPDGDGGRWMGGKKSPCDFDGIGDGWRWMLVVGGGDYLIKRGGVVQWEDGKVVGIGCGGEKLETRKVLEKLGISGVFNEVEKKGE